MPPTPKTVFTKCKKCGKTVGWDCLHIKKMSKKKLIEAVSKIRKVAEALKNLYH